MTLHLALDLDGTLADTAPGIIRAADAAWRDCFPEPPPDWRRLIGPPIADMLRSARPGADGACCEAFVTGFRRHHDEGGAWAEAVPYPGAGAALETIAGMGYRLHVVTNKPDRAARRLLAHLGHDRLLATIRSPDSQPGPAMAKAELIRALAGTLPTGDRVAAYVGDTRHDLVAAEQAGVRFIAFTGGYGQGEWPPAGCRSFHRHADLPHLLPPPEPLPHPGT